MNMRYKSLWVMNFFRPKLLLFYVLIATNALHFASSSLVRPLRSTTPALSSLLMKSAPAAITPTIIRVDQQYQAPKFSESSYIQQKNIDYAKFMKQTKNSVYDKNNYFDPNKLITAEQQKPIESSIEQGLPRLNAQQEAQLQQKLSTITFSMPKTVAASHTTKSKSFASFGQQARNYGTKSREYEPVEYSYNNNNKEDPATVYNKYFESLKQYMSNPLKTSTLYGSALHEAGHAAWIIYNQSKEYMISSGSIQQSRGAWGNIRIESIEKNKNYFSLSDQDKMNAIKMNIIGIVTQQVLDKSYARYQPSMLTNINDIMQLPGEYEGGIQIPKKADTVKVISRSLESGDIATIQNNVRNVSGYQHFDAQKDTINSVMRNDRKPNELHNELDVNALIDNQKLVAVISDVYPEVYNFVVQHKDDITAIADLLYEKGTVNGNEVYKVIKAQHPLNSPFSFDENGEFVGDGQGEFTADRLYKDYYDENRRPLYRYDKNGNDLGFAGTFNQQKQSKYRFDAQGNEVGPQGGYSKFGNIHPATWQYSSDYYTN